MMLVSLPQSYKNELKEYSGFCAVLGSSTDSLTYQLGSGIIIIIIIIIIIGSFLF
jgi:hypothetical protein